MESRGHELPIGAIVRRLERLEWESRRWKALAMLTAATLGMVLLIGAGSETSVPSELQARHVPLYWWIVMAPRWRG